MGVLLVKVASGICAKRCSWALIGRIPRIYASISQIRSVKLCLSLSLPFFIPLVDALLTCSTQLSDLLATLSTSPSAEILDSLRGLERKTSLVFTLLKASVYSIVLQQQIFGDEGEAGGPAPTLDG